MRIALIYLGRHGPGGPISFELASHLARKADLFAVVSKNADHVMNWRESGMSLIEVATFETSFQALFSCLNTNRLRKLADEIASRRPDVVLYPMVHPWTPALQRYLADIPHVTTVHDPTAHPGLVHRLSSRWEITSARRAARCVVLAQTFVEQMLTNGVARHKIDVIPHAVFSFYDAFPSSRRDSRTSPSILFFGRITPYKGLDVLIRAFQRLSERRPDLRLQIVGEGDMQPYRHVIDGLRNVTVVNRWVADTEVPSIFHSADIVVIPYVSASQSGVIALAASLARPVVATRVGAIPEQIRDRETGILVDPGSIDGLAAGIDALLSDGSLREKLATKLASEIRQNSNWEITSDAYFESCRKAMAMGINARR
jgi:glycosyltransferase involved in cell wall biosynthesis